jgi:hypothetical protein
MSTKSTPSDTISAAPPSLSEPDNTKSLDIPKEKEYITGVSLFLVVMSVTLICFLLLLDQSILSTVRYKLF